MRLVVFLILCSSLFAIDYPDQFFVKQRWFKRRYEILDGEKLLGTVVAPSYGVMECYSTKGEKVWHNSYNFLDYRSGKAASVHVLSDEEWFVGQCSKSSSTKIEIYDATRTLSQIFQAVDESRRAFVFIDVATGKILATALWGRQGESDEIVSVMDDQEWSVEVLDRKLDINILVWTLLKHSQKYLPSPYDAPFNIYDTTRKIKHPDGFTTVDECSDVVRLEDEQFIVTLTNGTVVNEGGVFTQEGKILKDTETFQEDQQKLLKAGRNISEESPIYFSGRLAVISSPGQENWYHWLLQVLPRLKLLENTEYDQIYLDNLKYPWQRESLFIVMERLGIPKAKLFLREGDAIVQASRLIVPSVPHNPAKSPISAGWLKEFLKSCFLRSEGIFDRIYISRSKASIRRIANEEALIDLLKERGFAILHLEEISPFDQAAIFHHAKVIVGPHGSGFANLIFSEPGTKVIEIDHGLVEEQRSYFKRFAEMNGCIYTPFYADFVQEEELENDITVDLATFLALLDSVLY